MKQYTVSNPKPGSHKINLIGEKFGMLTVLNYVGLNKHKNKIWLCLCECGSTCKAITTYLNNGKTTSCGCGKNRKGENSYNYTGYKDITGTKWNSIINNAKSRNLNFNITKKEVWNKLIEQNNKCYLTNLPISFKTGTASVDRVDNSLGYEKCNFVLTHKDVNLMRNKFDLSYFKYICNLIIKNKND